MNPLHFLYLFVHSGSIVLADGFRYLQHFHRNRAGAHGDLDLVTDLDLVAGFHDTAVNADTSIVASFVSNGPALN